MERTDAHGQVKFETIKNVKYSKISNFNRPSHANEYLCTALNIANTSTKYITGFEAAANATTAHHVTLHGCKTPGKETAVFKCGKICGSGTPQLLYGWHAIHPDGSSKDASKLVLPEDVGVPVSGSDTNIDWLVVQIHYKNIDSIPDEGDNAGVIVQYTDVPQPKIAGVLRTEAAGTYPAMTTTYNEAACQLTEDLVIHPFRYEVHTHNLGTVVSGWKVTLDMSWTLIGKKSYLRGYTIVGPKC